MPTGVGEPRDAPTSTLFCHNAKWLSDNRTLVISAHEPGCGIRLYQLDSVTGELRALSPEGVDPMEYHVVPHKLAVVAMGADQDPWLYPLDGGEPTQISRPVPVRSGAS